MDIQQVMKQAQAMQEKMQKVQENLGNTEIEGESGGGLVKITLTGKGVVTAVKISPDLIKEASEDDGDTGILEDLIAAAFNDTKTKIEDKFSAEMQEVAVEMGLPSDFKLPM